MSLPRLAATMSLLLGALCPVGIHALAHSLDSAHVHRHDDGTVHAHEHDAESHHDDEFRHADEEPRLAASATALDPIPRIEWTTPTAAASAVDFPSRLAGGATLDPPRVLSKGLAFLSSAGRAPPA